MCCFFCQVNGSEVESTIEDADKTFQAAIDVAKNNITIPGEATYVEAVIQSYENYRSTGTNP